MFFAEQVRAGHPDRIADLISESIVAESVSIDSNARCGIEVMVKGESRNEITVVVAGEMSPKIPYEKLQDIVIDTVHLLSSQARCADWIEVVDLITPQSAQIKRNMNGVNSGDQCIVYGYADPYAPRMLPLPYFIATNITREIDNYPAFEGGDGKILVGIDSNKNCTVVASVQRPDNYSIKELEGVVRLLVLDELDQFSINSVDITVNPGGDFSYGSVFADSGVTGRKIQCDTYGTLALNGGGNLNGKDGTKIDRVGAYIARELAIKYALSTATPVTTALAYMMGDALPFAAHVSSSGFNKTPGIIDWNIEESEIHAVSHAISLYGLDSVDTYEHRLADGKYGHFYSPELKWNKVM